MIGPSESAVIYLGYPQNWIFRVKGMAALGG
jgi:hypothetical protein